MTKTTFQPVQATYLPIAEYCDLVASKQDFSAAVAEGFSRSEPESLFSCRLASGIGQAIARGEVDAYECGMAGAFASSDLKRARYVNAIEVDLWLRATGHDYGLRDVEAQLPPGVKEKRKELLRMYRSRGGKRPAEGGGGELGALSWLVRTTGTDRGSLQRHLDAALHEEAKEAKWAPAPSTAQRTANTAKNASRS
jgi:hypothetical protein